MYSAIGRKLEDKKEIRTQFDFIKEAEAFKDGETLSGLITEIKDSIEGYIKIHEYYDVLSDGYVEFLRYSNSDKGLGIVLTPPHITELCVEIAAVDEHSVVIDNCCGTGGFLVAALRRMMRKSNYDSEKEKHIKYEQLKGIEYMNEIYAVCTANMILQGDGKSGIVKGDCFKFPLTKDIADVGLLNPPFRANKKEDTHEWEYVFNNLEHIKKGGKCVAVLPMQCALGTEKSVEAHKARLLKNHTLMGVISLPIDLFHDSKASVGACIVIIKAHTPHPEDKETWLAYGKDDGFVVRKHKGR